MTRYTKLDANGQPTESNHFAVRDETTGLIWSVRTLDEMDWQSASDACTEFDLLGQKDWRLPTRAELQGIVDYERRDPAIDTDAFPETPSDAFWSSSPVAGWPGLAWSVGFSGGRVGSWGRHYGLFVRPVRGPVEAK